MGQRQGQRGYQVLFAGLMAVVAGLASIFGVIGVSARDIVAYLGRFDLWASLRVIAVVCFLVFVACVVHLFRSSADELEDLPLNVVALRAPYVVIGLGGLVGGCVLTVLLIVV